MVTTSFSTLVTVPNSGSPWAIKRPAEKAATVMKVTSFLNIFLSLKTFNGGAVCALRAEDHHPEGIPVFAVHVPHPLDSLDSWLSSVQFRRLSLSANGG